MNYGKNIRQIRLRADLSQTELAKKAKLTQSYLSNIEVGRQSPSKKTLARICKALNIPVAIITIMSLEPADIKYGRRGLYKKLQSSLNALADLTLNEIYGNK